ncbi:MAG: hypothetical protein NVS3B25_19100 [Hymenobacter sp.]
MTRTATFTTPAREEIHLSFTLENGTRHSLFYSHHDYFERQFKHGTLLYPNPTEA